MKTLLLLTVCSLVLFSGCAANNGGTPSAATQSAITPSGVNAPASSPSVNFTAVGNMTTARADHVAILLPNGKVLIAGGVSTAAPTQALASAELYDPSTHNFTRTGNVSVSRGSPGAVLLANGKVLILGGSRDLSAELYDPSTGTFTATGNMISAGAGSSQSVFDFRRPTLLQDGRVLVEGVNAQIYDPATGTFGLTGAYSDANPLWDTSTLLQDGRVLLTGCVGPSSCSSGATELYEPRMGTFSFTGPMKGWDNVNTATLLMDGRVLFVEGNDSALPDDAEIYDPTTGTFNHIGNTSQIHEFSAAVRLPNGSILIAGGQLPGGSGSASTELYDPASEKFTSAGNMTVGRHSQTATLLPDGTVLIAGGYSKAVTAPTSSAEIYKAP